MLSWVTTRTAAVLVLLLLTTSTLALIRTIDSVGNQREVELLAERMAGRINAHLGMQTESHETIDIEGGYSVTIRSRSVQITLKERTASSRILQEICLWDPENRSEWGVDEFHSKTAEPIILRPGDVLVLETRNIKVGGVRTLETFAYVME